MEKEPRSNQLDDICQELQLRPVAQFRGAKKLELGSDDSSATMFLVENDERTRFNLKIGNFNNHEAEQTRWLKAIMADSQSVLIPEVISDDERHILFEHINGLPISRDSFWKQPRIVRRAFDALNDIDKQINQQPLTDQEIDLGRDWVSSKLGREGEWVKSILGDPDLLRGGLINSELVERIQQYANRHQAELGDMVRIWRDPNGDHMIVPYSDTRDERLGVVDIDISSRPRHYMPMRFLASTLTKIDDDRVDLETWVHQTREKYDLGSEMDVTFLLSLTGVLYDLTKGDRDNSRKREVAVTTVNLIKGIISKDEKEA